MQVSVSAWRCFLKSNASSKFAVKTFKVTETWKQELREWIQSPGMNQYKCVSKLELSIPERERRNSKIAFIRKFRALSRF